MFFFVFFFIAPKKDLIFGLFVVLHLNDVRYATCIASIDLDHFCTYFKLQFCFQQYNVGRCNINFFIVYLYAFNNSNIFY